MYFSHANSKIKGHVHWLSPYSIPRFLPRISIESDDLFNVFSKWAFYVFNIFTARKRSLGQGNIIRSVCQELCPKGRGGIPACIAAGLLGGGGGGGGIPACLAGFQVHTQGGS